jgi:nucleotide-binding universal stress UspA family protein
MSPFHHILFPVDFSDRCRSVRPFVRSLAKQCDAKLTLLHVVHIPAAYYGGFEAGYPTFIDVPALQATAKDELAGFFETPDVAFDPVVTQGDPAFEITRFAEANAVDLIMLPTHGYGKFRSLLLGSVAAKVLHDAHCGVWTAAHTEDPHLPTHLSLKSIMCAVDLSPESPAVIRRAVDVSASFGAKLRLVHAVEHAEFQPHFRFDDEFRAALLKSARESIDKMQAELGTHLEVCMEGGPAAEVIRDASLHHEADLVMIGRGAIAHSFGRLRSGAYDIVRESPCPVLSV